MLQMDARTVAYASRHPIHTPLVEMFVCAEPELGADGKITDYQIWTGFHFPLFKGDVPCFVYPQPH
jgi:hypothetical protein